ncbi:MAG: hypothetical protein JWR26_2387 [Pedosphaera sp.]|nr:hypothetical protein [Pedosphaera sp.]
MKRIALFAFPIIALAFLAWCLTPIRIGKIDTSTPMAPECVVISRGGDTNLLARHLRGVTDFVAGLGSGIKVQKIDRNFSLPLSRILPLPGERRVPYRLKMSFLDSKGESYEVVFCGEIGIEPHGLLSPRSFGDVWREEMFSQVYTVFKDSVTPNEIFK